MKNMDRIDFTVDQEITEQIKNKTTQLVSWTTYILVIKGTWEKIRPPTPLQVRLVCDDFLWNQNE